MGLYDNYRLANSNRVKTYQGSAVPEMVAVSTEMQKRYDTSQDNMDYTGKYLSSLSSLTQDQDALNGVRKQYMDSLQQIGGRKDLENMTRETSMLAQQLPQDYAPFAQRMKTRAEEFKKIDEDDKKFLTPESKQRWKNYIDASNGPIQKDPTNPMRYSGSYSSRPYAEEIDKTKFADEAMKDVAARSRGWSVEKIGNQWMRKDGGGWKKLETTEIDNIMDTAFAASEKWKAYMGQEKTLGTYSMDFSKIDPAKLNLDQQGLIAAKMENGKADFATAVKQVQGDLIQKRHEQEARNYAHKFRRDEAEQSVDYSENPFFRWGVDREDKKQENAMLQMANTMTLGGAKVEDVQDFDNIVTNTKQAFTESGDAYVKWVKGIDDGKVKYDLGGGRVGYKDAAGKVVDVTEDANAFRSQINYAKEKQQQLSAVDDAAKRASHYDKVPESVKIEAQKAASKARNTWRMGTEDTKGMSKEAIAGMNAGEAQKAFDEVMRSTKEYRAYKDELKKRMTGTTVGSDLFSFMNEKMVKSISENVEGLVSGLGLKNGMVPVQDKDGKQLSADDWKELQGNMRAIGVTYTGDPSSPVALVMRGFKDVKGKKTNGEDMIVKLPNTNIQSFAEMGMDDTQKDHLRRASGLAVALNNTTRAFSSNGVSIKANTNDPRGGWTLRVGDKETTAYSFKEIFEFMDANHK